MKKAVILDTSAIIYRNHFALMGMKNSKGMSTGATYGMINTLNAVLKEFNPDFLVACLDVKRSELKRSEDLETYKAHRESMPDELVQQLPKIMEVLDGYRVPKYKMIGYEADDVIATLASKFAADGIEVYVVTGDKDLMQLVDGHVNIALLGKGEGKSLFRYIRTDDDVVEYLGVKPNQVSNLFGLMGDSSDGIPGVQGIGPKTGVELINKYGDLETLYENIEDIKGKRKEKLIEDKEKAFLSRDLAEVHRNLDVEYDHDKLILEEKDYDILLPLYKEMEFKRFVLEIEKKETIKVEKQEPSMSLFGNTQEQKLPRETDKTVNTEIAYEIINLNKMNEKIDQMGEEISIYENEFGISICDNATNIVVLYNEENNKGDIKEVYSKIKNKRVVAYNIKDYFKKGLEPNGVNYFDVVLAWYVLGTESSQDLENIIFTEFGENLEKFEDQFKKRDINDLEIVSIEEKALFLSRRSYLIKRLETVLDERLKNEHLSKVYENIENKLIPVLAKMELEGIKVDLKYFETYKIELQEKIKKLEEEIYLLAGEKFNIGSPKQLAEILFEKLEIEPVKKTKTGYSTDVEVLEALALREISIAEKLLEYRSYAKLLSTYVEPLPKLVDENSRIHTTFNQNGTSTGRLSSTNPNLQNIPSKTEEGMKIRKGFVSKEGYSFISFDYSQIELRVLAELSKDENLVHAYSKDKDLHDLTARRLFYKTEEEEVTREERSIAKVINFSILYGKTPFGLSKELKIPMAEAKIYINTYFEQYPKVRTFLNDVLESARLNGFVETLYGTRRYISGINSSNKNLQAQAERMAVNTVVQGTAANILKVVMIELYKTLKDKTDIKMLLQVHDELIFEVKDESIDKYMTLIDDLMENTIKFDSVRLKANGNVAKTWGELK
ncbi:MAG: DNA polymerase I [Leptotrichiaceae bacterium]|jgi:DNA polymerase-1|nr:DNA polymerase I [Leptotrichiaceae bacterium]MBP6167344.1 DNA polymerase I [Leptotrichiaceae bacterium]MBP7025983.1 DNA polymerase I [Leptotrichiaceae bacterium]MBP8636413.1 DNA polymerase I [Leptotrichiaceae bacterium]MBP9538214.1 DNA polymerase I [Leptotrichiaceae bacterium]